MSIELKTVYFEKPGEHNTEEVFRIVRERADELGIKTILVASTFGDTAVKAMAAFKGKRVIIVGHSMGTSEPNVQKFTEENSNKVESMGGTILHATHVFMGVARAMNVKYNAPAITDIAADILRIFGQGMKVSVEISMMAADAGLVRTDEDVISISGSARGADTAIILKPLNSYDFFSLKVQEILCKPHF
ncbi:pyruvate kinase alpha/beta domain-containing protein [Chloroflexota bacterium]